MWQGQSGIMRNKYICALTSGSSLQKLALASLKTNTPIDPRTAIDLVWKLHLLRHFIATRMAKFIVFCN